VVRPIDYNYPPYGLSKGVQKLPEWIKLGCGDQEYICAEKGATFPGDECPDKMPDVSKHSNIMCEVLRNNPEIYDRLKNRRTAGGVGLAKCVKTGFDNPGHPMIKTVGLVGGDEESFTVFKDLFDPVISARHGGYAADATHPTDMNPENLLQIKIDPRNKYTLTTRCRTGRSVRGFALPPACTFEERRELERVIVKGLLSLDGELAGQYLPLHGSKSYGPLPGGMTEDQEEDLRKRGNLFQEPDSTLLLSSGCGRHWPDARGIFHNHAKNFFVWINEEDHMRIISMEPGDNVDAIFRRFAKACDGVQKVLKEEGYDFMHNDHLGFILTCPSNLGTGLRAGTMVKLPLMSARKDFKEICKRMGLQARGTAGVDSASTGGKWDVSNADRLGKSETHLVNIFIAGVSQLIKWEETLEKGGNIDSEVAKAKEWSR
jgi:creatine kinase